jgi:nucleotide-binding universal stress UspA family protein
VDVQRAMKDVSTQQLKRLSDEALGSIENAQVVALPDRGTAMTILDYADEHDVDLVVVGSHGRSGASRWLLGSVAERVVRHATCDTLVMSTETKGDKLFGERILATTDMSETSLPGLSAAHTLAQAFDADVTLLHVYDAFIPIPPCDHMEAKRSEQEAIGARIRKLDELRASHMGGSLRVSIEVIEGPKPAPAICRFVEEANHDLIVVAKHGRSAVERMLIGSVSEAIARQAQRPVLVVARPSD